MCDNKSLERARRMWADGSGLKRTARKLVVTIVGWIELVRDQVQLWASLLAVLVL